ncbi:MAG: dockerin type I repeat-containing protein, partial [Bacillota bacterium]|nr:dockerin type I repeat-containing protein [Bacillota bacterium]
YYLSDTNKNITYSKASLANLDTAVKNATLISNSSTASKSDIDAATTNLASIISGIITLPDPTLIGDVNNDNVVNLKDATLIQKYLAGLENFSKNQMLVASKVINNKTEVSLKDVTTIQEYLVGIVYQLPY